MRAAECGRFLPQVCAIYQQITRPWFVYTPRAIALLLRSSPASVASRIDVPTLIMVRAEERLCCSDSIKANARYEAIRRNGGAPADMVWFAKPVTTAVIRRPPGSTS